MIAVTTVRDEGAALVAKEALEARGIEVELKRLGANPYFGSPTTEEIEIRVPEERAGDARAVLDLLEEETEQALMAQAGVPADEDDDPDELPSIEERPRKISWSIAISLLIPFPGAGLMYARAFPLGLTLAGIFVGLFLLPALGLHTHLDLLQLAVGVKIVDAVLAPIFVVRFNRRLQQKGKNNAHA